MLKIRVIDIPRKGLSIDKVISPEDVGLDDPDFNFNCITPLTVQGRVSRVEGNTVIADGSIAGTITFVCGRCLEEVSSQFDREFKFTFELGETEDAVDIGEEIRQEVILWFSGFNSCSDAQLDEAECQKKQKELTIK